MRKLNITKDACKFVGNLDAKPCRQVIKKVFSLLANPTPNDACQLRGHDYWRADIGEFRIIYTFDEETVNVDLIGRRNDDAVYRSL